MLYYDYNWDLNPGYILLDEELGIERLKKSLDWHEGDYFKVVNLNGRVMLKKVDPLIAFVRAGAEEL